MPRQASIGRRPPRCVMPPDLLVLDDLVDHPVEVGVDELAGAADDERAEHAGDRERDHRAGDAVRGLHAAEQQGADDAADAAEDAGERLRVRPRCAGTIDSSDTM